MDNNKRTDGKLMHAGLLALKRGNTVSLYNGYSATAGRRNGLRLRISLVAAVTTVLFIGSSWAHETSGSRQTGRNRFLVLDSRIIDNTENAKLTLGQPQKHPANPLFGEDKPWEARFDNLYANVIYDEEEKIYKCWYNPFIVDYSARGMTPEEREKPYKVPSNREDGLCYATSKDGIKWDKPELGLVEFDGSAQNNIVWRTGPGIWGHGGGIFKDPLDLDPGRRYKAMFKSHVMSVGISADGIHWDKSIPCPEANADGDTHNNAFWAPTLGKYVGITRLHGKYGRQVARIESDDFVKWSKAEVVLEGLNKNLQTYAMPAFFHGGVYLGLVAIHDQKADRVWTELTWSPDTVKWNRVCPGAPLIANSQKEMAYDWGCVYASACPIFLDDQIRIYYGGCDGNHYGWRNGFFCLATLRPDGFAGYEPIDSEAWAIVTTKPIIFAGRNLCISADIPPGEFVKVVVKDEQGNKIAVGKRTRQTVTDGPVQWLENKNLLGKRVRLEFVINTAKLYSFSFTD